MKTKPIEIVVNNKEALEAIDEVKRGLNGVKQAAESTGLMEFLKWQTNKINQFKSKQRKAARIIALQKMTIDDLSKELAYFKANPVRAKNPCRNHDQVNPNLLADNIHVIGKGDSAIGYFRRPGTKGDKLIK